jgi:two-component system cell cycle response regulator
MEILIVEDDVTSKKILESILTKKGYRVYACANGHDALEVLDRVPSVSIMIVDWMMPHMSGIELCAEAKSRRENNPPYVILLTAKDTKSDLIFALTEGVDDYISKPYDLEELWARLSVAHRTVKLQNTLNKTKDRLKYQAYHDELTGVSNRRAILEHLSREWVRAKRGNSQLAVAMIDIDYFKKINDKYGHSGGDATLIQLCTKLKKCLREYDYLGRMGGEEFLVISPYPDGTLIDPLFERLRSHIESSFVDYDGQKFQMTMSIGVCRIGEANSFDELLEKADLALYKAKELGRNRVCFAKEVEILND